MSAHDPKSLREAIHRAANGADVDRLAELFEQAMNAAPDGEALYHAAMALWQAYEFERATRGFDRLVEQNLVDDQRLMQIARCYFSVGRFQQAASVMEHICRTRPGAPDALAMLAGCYERGNQLELATTVIEQALKVDPAHVPSVRLLAHIERRNGRLEAAQRRLQDRLAQPPSPDDWRLRYELAAVLDRAGEYDRAMTELEQAKRQLQAQTAPHLRQSYQIRQRQWELLQRLTHDDLRRWRGRAREAGDAPRLALLAGFPRSGTTLLEQMLAAHPDCMGTDETGILRTQFITPLVYAASSASSALEELRGFDAEQIHAGRAVYLRCTEAFTGESIGRRVLIEKDPLLTADLPLPLALFPEAHLLMPLRDPRDAVISYFFTMVPLNWNSAPATNLGEVCGFYADCMRHWLRWRGELGLSGLETRYEDLVSQPESELHRITDHLRLPWNERVLDVGQRSASKAIRTPTYDAVTRPIYKTAVGRWRHYQEYLEPHLDTLRPFLTAFNYDW